MNKLLSQFQDMPFSSTAISSSTSSRAVEIGSTEGPISMQLVWSGGITPNMSVTLELSNNKIDWTTMGGTTQVITTTSGNIMYDMPQSSGAEFMRIAVAVTAGSLIMSAYFNGKSR